MYTHLALLLTSHFGTAFDINCDENLPIACMVGGFHTLVSFLEGIGTLMKETGREDLLSEKYVSFT